MHNNTNYQCKICWNKALTFGVGSIQLSFRIYIPLCSPNTCKYVFNPNVTTLHFSAFIIISISINKYMQKAGEPENDAGFLKHVAS